MYSSNLFVTEDITTATHWPYSHHGNSRSSSEADEDSAADSLGFDSEVSSLQLQWYSIPSLIRPPYLPRNCGHIKEVAFGERDK